MKDLIIKNSSKELFKPNVKFKVNGKCEIQGDSYMKEPIKFYSELINWIKAAINHKDSITLDIRIKYFDSSSCKMIISTLKTFREWINKGKVVNINWFVNEEDIFIYDEVEDIITETGIPINKILIKSNILETA